MVAVITFDVMGLRYLYRIPVVFQSILREAKIWVPRSRATRSGLLQYCLKSEMKLHSQAATS